MQTEIEAKWININKDELRKKLIQCGAKCIQPERLMLRRNFDYPDKRLYKIGGWVRVRNEHDKTTLSYKQVNDRTLHGTKEVSVVVNDFAAICAFLEAIGLQSKSHQETMRESWILKDAQIELDTWPWIPPFIEIEAKSEESLKSVAKLLGLHYNQAMHGSVETAYQAEYNVTEAEIDSWTEIKFVAVPDWLREKKK
jgi:adenylate cyclase class 2